MKKSNFLTALVFCSLILGAWAPLGIEQMTKFIDNHSYPEKAFLPLFVLSMVAGAFLGRIKIIYNNCSYVKTALIAGLSFGFSIFIITNAITSGLVIYKFYASGFAVMFLLIAIISEDEANSNSHSYHKIPANKFYN